MLGGVAWAVVVVDDIAIEVGGVVFDGGRERSLGVGDMVDVVHPRPLMRGGW